MTTLEFLTKLTTETCYSCGMLFAMPDDVRERRLRDHQNFFCPAGHSQHYLAKHREEQLKDELAQQKQLREIAEARTASEKEARELAEKRLHRTKQRIGAGSCPCCKRHFKALSRHMACKHPEYKEKK